MVLCSYALNIIGVKRKANGTDEHLPIKVQKTPMEDIQGNCLTFIMHRQNHSNTVPADDTFQGWFSMIV